MKSALAYIHENGTRRGFPNLQYDGDEWYLDNKGSGRYSPKSNNSKREEVANRRNRQNLFTRDDYRSFAKEHGFSQEDADKHFDTLQTRLKSIARHKSRKHQADHVNAINLGGVEHWRNYNLLYQNDNGSKGDLEFGREDLLESGVGDTKEETMAMDFLEIPRDSPRQLRSKMYKKGLLTTGSNSRPSTGITQSELPKTPGQVAKSALNIASNASGPAGLAAAAGSALDDEVRNLTGQGVYDAIPNGTQEERRIKNGLTNGELQRTVEEITPENGFNDAVNGAAEAINNEAEYIHSKLSNGEIPYTDWIKESMLKWM